MTLAAVGRFIAVVGPSGAGKDSLINAARVHFGENGNVRFVRRVITRPATAGGEDHVAVSAAEFESMRDAGAFILDWQSHGLSYGIPIDVRDDLLAGRSVLANLSRAVIPAARQKFENFRVIVVTAPVPVLAARLAARGREDQADIEERLRRAPQGQPVGDDVTIVENAADLDVAASRFIDAIALA